MGAAQLRGGARPRARARGRAGRARRDAAQVRAWRTRRCAASAARWSSATPTTSTSCSRSGAPSSARRRRATAASCSPRRSSSSRWRCSRRPRAPRPSPAWATRSTGWATTTRPSATLRRSLQADSEHAEARIYLANVLYDRGDYEASLYHFERTTHRGSLGRARHLAADRAEARRVQARRARRRAEAVGGATHGARWRARRHRRAVHRGGWRARRREWRGGGGARASSSCSARFFPRSPDTQADDARRRAGDGERIEVCTRDGRQLTGSWEEIVRVDAAMATWKGCRT